MASSRRKYVYIMASEWGVLYTGVTSALPSRVLQHKHFLNPRCFTAKYRCTRLVYFEEHPRMRDAIEREKKIKGWIRAKKVALISRMNPDWSDLSEQPGFFVLS
jgi:putative endonuclease